MASVNLVVLVGNLGKDPESRFMPNGTPVTNITIATSSKKDGQEYTQWHRCVAYDKVAEILNQYAKKGNQIYVQGTIRYGKYTNKDGVEQHTTDIIVHQVQLLGRKEEGEQPRQEQRQQPQRQQQPAGDFDGMDEDLPF